MFKVFETGAFSMFSLMTRCDPDNLVSITLIIIGRTSYTLHYNKTYNKEYKTYKTGKE